MINNVFLETINSYDSDLVEIYTDGSRTTEGEIKVAAAFIIPNKIVLKKFRLNPITSVLGSELYAIERALDWVKVNRGGGKFLILTDSKSSLYLIKDKFPNTHQDSVLRIQEMTHEIFCMGGELSFSGFRDIVELKEMNWQIDMLNKD